MIKLVRLGKRPFSRLSRGMVKEIYVGAIFLIALGE
jgi:hypothetical protein